MSGDGTPSGRGRSDVPQRLGPCRLLFEIGSGGMGTVHLAEMVEAREGAPVGTRVAVKVLHAERAAEPEQVERFRREARLGARLTHPTLVRVLDHGTEDGTQAGDPPWHFLVMEHVEGRTLRSLLAGTQGLPEPLVRDLALQVAAALAALHAQGTVHRDVKPENVLITSGHQVRLMDLGVARADDSLATADGQFVGSLAYASPEHLGTRPVVAASDLYSLGVVLFEMLAGERPFRATALPELVRQHLERVPPRLGECCANVSPFIEDVVATLLEKDPERRFASAVELCQVLEAGEGSAWWLARDTAVPALSRSVRVPVRRDTALIGREAELTALRRCLSEVRAGAGRVVLLGGEAGIGKSRLVDEVVRGAQEAGGWDVLFGSYPPGGGTASRGALAEAIVARFGPTRLRSELAARLTQTPRIVAPLADLLLGDIPAEGSGALSRGIVGTAYGHLLGALAADRPLLWMVDDLHFATAEDRALVAALARAAALHRAVLLVTFRPGVVPPEELANLERLEATRRIDVARLADAQVTTLLTEILASASTAGELRSRVAARADGNPFFLLELVRELEQRGSLRRRPDGSFEITGSTGRMQVPSSVRGLMLARLQVLDPADRELVDVAAVSGYRFDPDLVARVLERRRLEVLQAFARVEQRTGIVRGEGSGLRFDHHQVQEVLYEVLSPPLRQAYHAAIATEFQQRGGLDAKAPGEVPGSAAAFIAAHALRGRDQATAAPFIRPALLWYRGTGQSEALTELCELTFEVLDPALAEQRGIAWELLLDRHALNGPTPAHQEAVAQFMAESQQSCPPELAWRPLAMQARLTMLQGRLDEAWELYTRLLEGARAEGSLQREKLAHQGRGTCFLEQGRFEEALAEFEAARVLRMPSAPGGTVVSENVNAIICLAELGLYARAEAVAVEALKAAERMSYALGTVVLELAHGWVMVSQGRLAEARARIEATLVEGLRAGGGRQVTICRTNLAEVARLEGRLDEVRDGCEQCLAECLTVVDARSEGYSLRRLGDRAHALGRLTEARSFHERALELRRRACGREAVAESLTFLARTLVALGETDAAVAALEEADGLVQHGHMADLGVLPAAWLARLGRRDAASVVPTERCLISARIETHLCLHLAGAPGDHLEQGLALLDSLHSHLSGDDLARARTHWPIARELLAARDGAAGRRPGRVDG